MKWLQNRKIIQLNFTQWDHRLQNQLPNLKAPGFARKHHIQDDPADNKTILKVLYTAYTTSNDLNNHLMKLKFRNKLITFQDLLSSWPTLLTVNKQFQNHTNPVNLIFIDSVIWKTKWSIGQQSWIKGQPWNRKEFFNSTITFQKKIPSLQFV